MNVPWKIKSTAFAIVDRLNAPSMLYWLQRYATRRSVVKLTGIHKNWAFHRDALEGLGRVRVLEFGAGKSLAQNLYLSQFCEHQTVVDLLPMMDASLVDSAAQQLTKFGLAYYPIKRAEDLEAYGITYRAPYDLIESDLENASFDACISTNTLEHIPRDQIVRIYEKLRRIVRAGGIISAVIDYSDHYAHTDKSISRVEYLRYDERSYRRHNHSCHYQNRLRHSDHIALLCGAGFVIEQEQAAKYTDFPLDLVSREFRRNDATLLATKGLLIASNP